MHLFFLALIKTIYFNWIEGMLERYDRELLLNIYKMGCEVIYYFCQYDNASLH